MSVKTTCISTAEPHAYQFQLGWDFIRGEWGGVSGEGAQLNGEQDRTNGEKFTLTDGRKQMDAEGRN